MKELMRKMDGSESYIKEQIKKKEKVMGTRWKIFNMKFKNLNRTKIQLKK